MGIAAVRIIDTSYGKFLLGEDGLAVPGSVFRFVEFPGAGGMQVEILSGTELGMRRLVGPLSEARDALVGWGLAEWLPEDEEVAVRDEPDGDGDSIG